MDDLSVFKSYLRNLLRELKNLQKALKANDIEESKRILNEIIEDTQKGIED